MYLLNRAKLMERVDDGIVVITNFEVGKLGNCFYKFGISKQYRLWIATNSRFEEMQSEGESIVIPGQGYAIIQTSEKFFMPENIYGLISSTSETFLNGVILHNSLKIDPYFIEKLEMGLQNMLNVDVTIKINTAIGKIYFYEMSESTDLKIPNPEIDEKNLRRSQEKFGQDVIDQWY